MRFFLNYDNGYVVTYLHLDEHGYIRHTPLRKFAEQGDAIVFRNNDCPRLTESQLRLLMRNYNPEKVYKRINEKRFVLLHETPQP